MRKVIKIVTFLMTFVLFIVPNLYVYAGSINQYEAELIEIGNGVFNYNGVDYVATEAAKQRVINYLMQNDVNLSASQAEEAKSEFWGNLAKGISDGYLVRLNPETEDTSGSGANSSQGSVSDNTDAPEINTETTYTYKDLVKIMYAKQAVNVRTLPSTDGERIGSLSVDERVKVIGQCIETGWYRILYNEVVAYVSDNYLIDNLPIEETEETEVTTEESTEILDTEQTTETDATESVTEIDKEAETEATTESESDMTETEIEPETETVLREKNFNKGLNMTIVAIITAGIVLVAAVIIVISHKNRRF